MGKQKLTRKELVDYIKRTMPSDLDEIEKLAFIENEIAKQISFDEQYLWGDRETKEKIYKLHKSEAQRPHKKIKRKLICVTMAELFGYVAKELGLEVYYQKRAPGLEDKTGGNDIFRKVTPKKQEHVCPIVKLSNGQYVEIDIQSDLYRIQTRSKPKAFGLNRTQVKDGIKTTTIDDGIIEKTFRKIYKLEENEKFTDEYIMEVVAMLWGQHKSPIEMLEFLMNDPRIQKELQNTRCIEANKLYKKILAVCYGKSEYGMFVKGHDEAIIEECILSDDKGQKRYSFCVYAQNDKQKKLYIYSKRSRRMVKLSQNEVQHMTGELMNIQLRGRPSEFRNKIMSLVRGEHASDDNLTEEYTGISCDEIFIEEDEEELE